MTTGPQDLGILLDHVMDVKPENLQWCPATTSLVAYDPLSDVQHVLPVRCRRWTCEYCRVPNEILLKERVAAGDPNRMLTLTARPLANESPKETHVRIRPKISRLYAHLRREVGAFEAATFLELHRSGWPHWHALCRCPYIEQPLIKRHWERITGSYVVDIRLIRDASVSRRYVTKYVTKQLAQQIFNRLGRVVTFTRAYTPTPEPSARPRLSWERDPRSPLEIVAGLEEAWCPTWAGRTCSLKRVRPAGYRPPPLVPNFGEIPEAPIA